MSEDIDIAFTIADALEEVTQSQVGSGEKRGYTSSEIASATGWSIKKVRRVLRELAKHDRLEVNIFPVQSLLDGKSYPTPHYLIKTKDDENG